MRLPTYLYRRPDTGSFLFRWVVPAFLRSALGGRREIRRTLNVKDKRQALEAARQLSVALERGALLVAKHENKSNPGFVMHALLKYIEQFADGSARTLEAELNPDRLEDDHKALDLALKTLGMGRHTASNDASPASGMTLTELMAAYFAEGVRAQQHTSKTRQEIESTFTLMAEVMGKDKPVAQLTRKDFTRFKDVLQKLPTNRTKDKRWRGKTVLELAGMDIPSTDLLKVNTINKILDRVSSLMGWGKKHGHVTANHAEGMSLPVTTRRQPATKREPYADSDVAKLLNALLSGAHDTERKPWRKWVPLMGLYTGARLNELCQLHVADFIEIDGIPCVNITDEGDVTKRVKNENSRRIVPIHPELVRLGLLEYVEQQRKNGMQRLFPQLSASRDGYGKNVSRWYAELMGELEIKRDFHALRHGFISRMREAGIDESLIADIVGHRRSEKITFNTYARAASVKRMSVALSQLAYNTKSNVVPFKPAEAA